MESHPVSRVRLQTSVLMSYVFPTQTSKPLAVILLSQTKIFIGYNYVLVMGYHRIDEPLSCLMQTAVRR